MRVRLQVKLVQQVGEHHEQQTHPVRVVLERDHAHQTLRRLFAFFLHVRVESNRTAQNMYNVHAHEKESSCTRACTAKFNVHVGKESRSTCMI